MKPIPFNTFVSLQRPVADCTATANQVAASVEEVAAWLSVAEGRPVTVQEVRRIETQALRKLRQVLHERGYAMADLLDPG